ncbi:MAG TPA: double-strand break repair protein AddB [Methylocella sp.]|nr:double-strand break repair protein AddB [Methylocella sp.]
MHAASVFSIPPGAPFLKTFAAALLEGRIVESFHRDLDPLAIADATIYVPTRRAAKALALELQRTIGRPSILLPRILPLGALDDAEAGLFFDEDGVALAFDSDLPEAAGGIQRRLLLTQLIYQWASVISHAIVSIRPDGTRESDSRRPFLVGTTPADAWHLSGDLAKLIDELIIEDVSWKKFDRLALPEFDPYWGITLDFLNIAIEQWPRILGAKNLVDKARRQVTLIDAQKRRLESGAFTGPVLAIGSTGSNSATACLLAAIARTPNCAVVLPGLDDHLDEDSWSLVAGGPGEPSEASSFAHPQAALCRLLPILKIKRGEILSLGEVAPPLAMRRKFISEALRPAETTNAWMNFSAIVSGGELALALKDITLIEARDDREEALVLAIAMREVLETRHKTAALVTPDRKLARRVHAELRRWKIDVADSAGEALSATPLGALARLVLACVVSDKVPVDLAALMAHPSFRLALSREDAASRAEIFEIAILRSSIAPPVFSYFLKEEPPALIARIRKQIDTRFSHPALSRVSEEQWEDLGDFLGRLLSKFEPLLKLKSRSPLSQWITAHRGVLEAIAEAEDAAIDGMESEALAKFFDALNEHAPARIFFDAQSYARFFDAVAREETLFRDERAHPRLQILGLLEARLMESDVVLLGGLDEGIWPPQGHSDALLNRSMRAALGLAPPERKLGQTAHDFTQAMGKREVFLSRARKRDGAPTVASRFLQRMAALGGESFEACRKRGDRYLHYAREIDKSEPAPPCERPMPRPPVERRPKRLSVTQVETLRRDPYAIYADKILELKELAPLGGDLGFSEFGRAVHAALNGFVSLYPAGPLPKEARAVLQTLLHKELAMLLLDPHFVALQSSRIEKLTDFYLAFEGKRREGLSVLASEVEGKLELLLKDGSQFLLTARADRIERGNDEAVTIIDYKTGSLPRKDDIERGFAPQLPLEAAMCANGAFGAEFHTQSLAAIYVKLGGPAGGKEEPIESNLWDMAKTHLSGLMDLLNQFREAATPYPSRPFPEFAKRYNAYDHLARVAEWSRAGDNGEVD